MHENRRPALRRLVRLLLPAAAGLLWALPTLGQPCGLRVSLLTCGTGDDLYACFGHSAVRVVDSSRGFDYVFNYGTFDFDRPDFYWQFTRGKLPYYLSVQDYPSFLMAYRYEHRKVIEQVLDLSCAQREAVWQFLQRNYQPENRYYQYDFLFDNCSTRIRDIFSKVLGPAWSVPDVIPEKGMSFRSIINGYLGGHPWERLGINLLFGTPTDAVMQPMQVMFLPDYLMAGVGASQAGGRPLVGETRVAYDPGPSRPGAYPLYRKPLFWFILLALAVALATRSNGGAAARILPWVDRCLFFLTGLLGCFMLFMWFGTDHRVCAWNYNLLWAFPPHLVFSFYTRSRGAGTQRYALLTILLNLVVLTGWFVLPQQFPLEVLPLVAILTLRAWGIFRQARTAIGRA